MYRCKLALMHLLLQSVFDNSDVKFMHVMHWRSRAGLEALTGSQAFLQLLSDNTPFFTIDTAEIFTTVD